MQVIFVPSVCRGTLHNPAVLMFDTVTGKQQHSSQPEEAVMSAKQTAGNLYQQEQLC
jgi:hypothetical protein